MLKLTIILPFSYKSEVWV